MGVPSSPGSSDLAKAMNRVGKNVQTSKFKFANWNVKVGRYDTRLPDKAFRDLSRAAKFYREGYYTPEQIKEIQQKARDAVDKAKEVSKEVGKVQKNIDKVKKPFDKFLEKIPGRNNEQKAGTAGSAIGGLLLILGLTVFVTAKQFADSWLQDQQEETNDYLRSEIQKNFNNYIKQAVEIKSLNKKADDLSLENQRVRDRVYGLEKQQPTLRDSIAAARKLANDTLYEYRQNFKNIKQFQNDITYEVRKGRQDLERRVTTIQSNIDTLKGRISEAIDTARKAFIKIEQLPKPVNGKDGKDGLNGKDGKHGLNGKDGKDGITTVVTLPGTPGKQGERGLPGIPGKDGKDGINGKDGKDGKDVDKAELAQLNQKLDRIPPLFAAIPKPLDFNQTVNAAATGTCRTTQPGGCSRRMMDDAVKNINDKADNLNKGLSDKLNSLLNAFNAGANAAQMALLTKIDGKLGSQLKNGISGAVSGIANNQLVQSTVNYLTMAATIHNGLMLSNNFIQTLLSTVDVILKVFGIELKNAENENMEVGQVISSAIKAALVAILGEAQYKASTEAWNKFNRIYQSAANLLNALQSIGQSILNALEVVGGWVAKIGNALRTWGEVSDKAYNWFHPQPNFQNKFFTGLETTTNVVSQINTVASEVLSIKETVGQIQGLKQDLVKNLNEDEKSSKGLEVPEAKTTKKIADESKEISKGQDMSENDFNPDED